MDGMTAPPVFSALDLVTFTPPGSPRTYRLAPLTYRERIAFRAALAREAGMRPSPQDVSNGLRAALREIAPANLDAALAVVDEADAAREAVDATPDDAALKAKLAEAQARLAVIITACMDVPVYAELRAAGERWTGMAPWVACRHALRGWDGPGLPAYLSRFTNGQLVLNTRAGGVGYSAITRPFSFANAVTFRMAIAWANLDAAFCLDGGTVSGHALCPLPATPARIAIGAAPWSEPSATSLANATCRAFQYFPRRLSNALLQTLTAP